MIVLHVCICLEVKREFCIMLTFWMCLDSSVSVRTICSQVCVRNASSNIDPKQAKKINNKVWVFGTFRNDQTKELEKVIS